MRKKNYQSNTKAESNEAVTSTRKSKKGNKKGARNYREPKDPKETEKIIERTPDAKFNKVEYYVHNNLLLDQVSQLSFQHFLGATPIGTYNVPTIERIFMNPSPGVTYHRSVPTVEHVQRSGINLAAMKLFTKLSMHSGRNMQYAPQDVATMLLALSQIFAMHSFTRRLFGAINISNYWNRMFPQAIVNAMGIDYDDFVAHYADYRTRYNALLATVNKVPILFNCGYLEKSATQYDFMWTDDESPLSQIYLYLPESTWIMDEASYSGGTILKTVPVCPHSGTRTFADLLVNVLRPMAFALQSSSTLNLVYADLLRLSKDDPTVKFTTLDPIIDGFAVMPIHSYEALLHIHNMECIGVPSLPELYQRVNSLFTPFNDVYPDPSYNALVYNPCFADVGNDDGKVPETIIWDSPTPEPDAATRLEMSRYTSCRTNNFITPTDQAYWAWVILSDYYVTFMDIIKSDVTSPIAIKTLYNASEAPLDDVAFAAASQFDWHPLIKRYDKTTGEFDNVFGDLTYFTTVPVQHLERLNEVTYLGLFDMDRG